jgi:hypothetical protein
MPVKNTIVVQRRQCIRQALDQLRLEESDTPSLHAFKEVTTGDVIRLR